MCARRFLAVVFVLTLIVVVAAFAFFQFANKALIKTAIPTGHYQVAAAGSGPDYSDPKNWVARPGLANDPSHWLPEGMSSNPSGAAAVFYIHPTTYLERDRWNAPLQADGDTEFRTRLFVQSQSSAFNAAGDVWAPRYRQAAFGAFLLDSDDAQKALNLAYSDVSAAFDQFLKEAGDRPIILAGHSQGGLQLERLLKDKVAGKPIAKRIVAAYVVGWPISTTADLPALGLPSCRKDDQTGCILSWMSFGDPPNPELVLDSYEHSAGFSGRKRRREDLLCVNPISGTQNGVAAPESNPGTLVPNGNLTSATLSVGQVGAHCVKGLLILDGTIPAYVPPPLPGNNFHVYDYALFWGAIRRDSERRLAAWHR